MMSVKKKAKAREVRERLQAVELPNGTLADYIHYLRGLELQFETAGFSKLELQNLMFVDEYEDIQLFGYRQETSKEVEIRQRLAKRTRHKKQQDRQKREQQQRRQYEKLKKKFEGS